MFLDIEKLKNSLNWQETGKFEEKRAAAGRRMKSIPILGHLPNSFLTSGRRFQSSPIGWVNCGIGNTESKLFDYVQQNSFALTKYKRS